MRKRTINLILIIFCLTLIFLTLVPLLLNYYVGPKITRRVLEEEVEKLLQKRVKVERAGITIFRGFGIEYKDLRILGPDGEESFRADTIMLKPWIQSLILGRLKWRSIILEDPSVHLIRTSEGHFNLFRKTRKKAKAKDPGFFNQLRDVTNLLPSQLSIRGGRIRFTDFRVSHDPVVTEIEDIEVTSHDISTQKPFSFHLAGRFTGDGEETFSVSGKVTRAEEPPKPNQLEFSISLKANGVDSRRIWPYVRSVLPFKDVSGRLDLKIRHEGGLASFHSSGEIGIQHGRFAMPPLFKAAVEPGEVALTYDLEYGKDGIHISQLVIRAPKVSVRGSGSIQDAWGSNPSISLEFSTGKTSFDDIRPYLPDRLIPKRLLSFLADSRIQGLLQVEGARLEGPWAHFSLKGLRKNPEMLSARVHFNNCRLLVNQKLPPFRSISGVLILEGDQAHIQDFHGRFLRTRLVELDGTISQIYSHPRMAINLSADLDLKSLHSVLRGNKMLEEVRKACAPVLSVSGKAKMAGEIQYVFNNPTDLTYKGKITLSRIHLSLASLASPLTDLGGVIRYNEKEIRLSKFNWKMGKSHCQGNGSIRDYLIKRKKRLTLSKAMKISLNFGVEEIHFGGLLRKDREKHKIQIGRKSLWLNSAVNGKVRISKGSFRGLRLANLEANFALRRGLLRFKNLRAQAPGGFVRCRGWINLRCKRGISFKLVPEIHQLNMTNVTPIFLDHKKGPLVSGALNLDGIIAGHGDSAESITEGLRGDLRLHVTKGNIQGIEALKGKTLPYKQATARIAIQGGVASTEDLYLDSDAISMTIRGQADLNDQNLDILIGIRPLQTVDKILSNVPVAGWLLAGKDRSILTFGYRVKGKFNDLKVETRQDPNKVSGGR